MKTAAKSSVKKAAGKSSGARQSQRVEPNIEGEIHAITEGKKRLGTRIGLNAARRATAGFVCAHFDAEEVWKSILESKDERIKLAGAKYLTDRLYGKAAQAVKLSGEIEQKITVVVDL